MGSYLGTLKVAAKAVGLTIDEYVNRVQAGLKRCRVCKAWLPIEVFAQDRSRGDGRKTICQSCNFSQRFPDRPSLPERKARKEKGEFWCSRCKAWAPLDLRSNGGCNDCVAKAKRERYATDAEYRNNRRNYVYSRKRKVEPVAKGDREFSFAMWEGLCAYCGDPADTIDHIVPVSKGGTSAGYNLVPACRRCNSSKNNRDVDEFLDSLDRAPDMQLLEQIVHLIPL